MTSKDYSKAKVYKILYDIDDACYIGSTSQTLSKRMSKHRQDMKSEVKHHRPLHMHMIEHGIDNFYIELVANFPCESVELSRKREGELIRKVGTLNKIVAGRTKMEAQQAYRDAIFFKKREKNTMK